MTLGDMIRKYRNENHLSMEEFGRRAGMTKGYVNMIEKGDDGRGKRPHPTIERMTSIANALGMSLTQLIDSVDDYKIDRETIDYVENETHSVLDSIDETKLYGTDDKTQALGSMMLFLNHLSADEINKLHQLGEILFS